MSNRDDQPGFMFGDPRYETSLNRSVIEEEEEESKAEKNYYPAGDDPYIYQYQPSFDDDEFADKKEDSDGSSDSGSSVLSEISNEDKYFENKVNYQRRALFRKNATLQMRQFGTNIC
jgi:hypothetical protein